MHLLQLYCSDHYASLVSVLDPIDLPCLDPFSFADSTPILDSAYHLLSDLLVLQLFLDQGLFPLASQRRQLGMLRSSLTLSS